MVIGIAAIVLVLMASTGMLNIFGTQQPDCVFTESQQTCDYPVNLPVDRTATSWVMTMTPDAQLYGTVGTPETAVYTDSDTTINTPRGIADTQWFLYPIPQTNKNFAEIKVDVTATAQLDCFASSNTANLKVYIYSVRNYENNQIDKCMIQTSSGTCSSPDWLLKQTNLGGTNFYDDQNSKFATLIGSQIIESCSGVESLRTTGTYSVTIPESLIERNNTANQQILIAFKSTQNGGSAQLGAPQVVQIATKTATFPTNLEYSIGSVRIETLVGEHKTEMQSLDVADQINAACGRNANNNGNCDINVQFKSTTPGKLWIESEYALKIAIPVPTPTVEPSITPTVNPTITPTIEPTASPTPNDWFKFNWDTTTIIVVGIIALSAIVGIVMFVKK